MHPAETSPATGRVALNCFLLLRAEVGRRLVQTGRWNGMPDLLDELDALRRLQQHTVPKPHAGLGHRAAGPRAVTCCD